MRDRIHIWFLQLKAKGRYLITPQCPLRGCGQKISWWEFIIRNRCALHWYGLLKEDE